MGNPQVKPMSCPMPGTVRTRSEYTYHDVVNDDVDIIEDNLPILAGLEAHTLKCWLKLDNLRLLRNLLLMCEIILFSRVLTHGRLPFEVLENKKREGIAQLH